MGCNMNLFIYDEENDKEIITDKFSVVQKFGFGDDTEDCYTSYEIGELTFKNNFEFLCHSKLMQFLLGFYGCDTVVDACRKFDMGMEYQRESGFFIIKNDIIDSFITTDYAYGLRDGVESMQKKGAD